VICFRVISAPTAADLEDALNAWALSLPAGARIRRTQLSDGEELTALINYELPDRPARAGQAQQLAHWMRQWAGREREAGRPGSKFPD
jgi:hypothetical protein